MFNFNFSEKVLGLFSSPQSVYDFSHVIFYKLTKFHFLIAFTSWDIGQYVYYNCYPGCGIIKFDNNLIFVIKPFCYMTKKSRQKFKCIENEKNYWSKIKNIFLHFLSRAFSCQKLTQTWKCIFKGKRTPLTLCERMDSLLKSYPWLYEKPAKNTRNQKTTETQYRNNTIMADNTFKSSMAPSNVKYIMLALHTMCHKKRINFGPN